MPFFDYACAGCAHEFEQMIRHADDPVACPRCGAARVERKMPRVSIGRARSGVRPGAGPGPCGPCGDPRGPGACSLG